MNMFHWLPTVCIVFCLIAKYTLINFINKLISFLMKAECVLCKTENNCLYVI